MGFLSPLLVLVAATTANVPYFEADELAGTWRSGCIPAAPARAGYEIDELHFDENLDFERVLQHFDNAQCAEPATTDIQEIDGMWALGENSIVAGARDLDVTVDAVFTTPVTESTVSNFLSSGYCNIMDWKRGERRSLLGMSCADLIPMRRGAVIFDLVRLSDDHLFLGKKSYFKDAEGPGRRPTSLNPQPYIRVNTTETP